MGGSVLYYILYFHTEATWMERLQKFKPTTLADRTRFVWLWRSGLSARNIAQESGTSVTTVCRWIRRWRREGNVATRPRSGRPRKTEKQRTDSLCSNMHHLAAEKNDQLINWFLQTRVQGFLPWWNKNSSESSLANKCTAPDLVPTDITKHSETHSSSPVRRFECMSSFGLDCPLPVEINICRCMIASSPIYWT